MVETVCWFCLVTVNFSTVNSTYVMVQQVKEMDSNNVLKSVIPPRHQQNLTILDLHVHTCVWCVQHVLVGTCGESMCMHESCIMCLNGHVYTVCTYVYLCMHACMCVCIYVRMYTYVCTYVYLCMYVCMCTYIHMITTKHMWMYIYIFHKAL